MNLMDFVCRMWLLKVSMQIKSGPMPHLHFCEQNVMLSFYSVAVHRKRYIVCAVVSLRQFELAILTFALY